MTAGPRWSEPVRLTDGRVVLREWTRHDLATLVELFDDPAVARFTPLPSPFDAAAAAAHLDRARERRAAGTAIQLAITTGDVAARGEVLLFRVDGASDAAELAYAVGAAHRGRGLGAAALRLLTAHGARLGFPRLRLRIEPGNVASQRIARAAGYAPAPAPVTHTTNKGHPVTLERWEWPARTSAGPRDRARGPADRRG